MTAPKMSRVGNGNEKSSESCEESMDEDESNDEVVEDEIHNGTYKNK